MKKFKENFKRFWSLQKHSTGGFTLVELIVVIAILAILAGIAVPAYSGYVEKANKQADQTLLNAVNTAFAASCSMAGSDMHLVEAAALDASVGTPINGISAVKGIRIDEAAVKSGFDTFFTAENPDAQFEVIQPVFVEGLGFVAMDEVPEGTSFTVGYGGGVLTLNAEAIEALKNTTFFESMGTEGILKKVSDVAGFAALLGGDSAMQQVYDSEAFQEHAAAALGVDTSKEGWEDEAFIKIDAMCQEVMAKDPTLTWDAAYNMVQANAAVIHAAKNASEMDAGEVMTLLTGENVTDTIRGNLDSDPSLALSQAALAYGMYTAYAHSTGNADLIASTDDPLQILRNLDDPDFKYYLENNPRSTADLDGYMSALGMVNDTSKDTDAVTSVLVNGFNDPTLAELLGGLIG